ncbi:MAG: hypothetical protein M0R33_03910 [Methylomonas sp.]|uniref:hypothetical protein n=1 Tax=Methylomonas sp. TaxID=418 RepID=UPI0025E9A066|nr:hypothetical protein [Methylomonas sp.]MCK9605579.1 hypothetical protein [Methylomonas sp.]
MSATWTFAYQQAQRKGDFCAVTRSRSGGDNSPTLRSLKAENQRQERELNRRHKALADAAARQDQASAVLDLSPRNLQRWQAGETLSEDQRPQRQYTPPHTLTEAVRAAILVRGQCR